MKSALCLYVIAGLAVSSNAFPSSPQATDRNSIPLIQVDGIPFETWGEYLASDLFTARGLRCGIPERATRVPSTFNSVPGDCGYNSTNPTGQYAPTFVYEIPVVVHVITSSGGQGNITDAKVQSQIDILNEDFLALAGSNGSSGTNSMIQFHLATVDPNGNATNGITRTTNTNWFNDNGQYWNTLAWDTNRYLNIYTNQASGALGYVPDIPQGGIVGQDRDRVVVLWSSFGRNAPIGPPYNQGRTTTHEVGHYFGLEHTFTGGCASAGNCNSNGDLICDTNPESQPAFGCPNTFTCGSSDPTDNYLDYSDDLCMEMFTQEQSRRMRCTIEYWRPDLPTTSSTVTAVATIRNGSGINPLSYLPINRPLIGSTWQSVISGGSPLITVIIPGLNPTSATFIPSGELLVQPPFLPFFVSSGFHSISIPNDPSLLGRQYVTQGATLVSGVLTLTNAVDMTIGNI